MSTEASQILDAIRLALIGAKDDATAVAVITALIGPEPEDWQGTVSVQLLVDAIRATDAKLEVVG